VWFGIRGKSGVAEGKKITLRPSAKQLGVDSEKYRLKALQLGVSDVKIVPASPVVIDERLD